VTVPAGTAGGRVPGFDAARAAAISCVLICHFGIVFCLVPQVSPPLVLTLFGYFGVELFFVLSGYLIGSILIEIRAAGGGVRAGMVFLVRRWMRTLPAYYAVLFVVAAFGSVAVSGWQLFDYVSLTQNFAWAMRAPDFFAVSWSLTIEEWFYVLFGFVLIAMVRRGRLFALFWIGLFLVLPLILRCEVPASANWDDDIRKVVCTRLDAILYGCRRRRGWPGRWAELS
jgi:peptidoglycan/LPS O-acetylase OafA/YrhL